MELIESKQILKNLNAVLLVAKERLAREFIMQDVELNDIFKVDFKNYLSEKNWEVEYFRSTTVITNHQGQNIYVANQWFVIASYFVDFCTELLTYRNLFVKLCKEYLGLNAEEMKKYATRLKTCPTIADEQLFLEKAMSLLVKDFPEKADQHSQAALYLWKFASEYKWWAGSKTVDRHDFYISALLNQMNVVNNNSEFLAIICNAFASSLVLRLLTEIPENFTNGLQCKNCIETSVLGNKDKEHEGLEIEDRLHYEFQRGKGISISAASLERFQSKK